MLISFSVSNFRSFDDLQTISFNLNKTERELLSRQFKLSVKKRKYRILKNALFFGANASGKSNIFVAINFLANLVTHPNSSDAQGLPTDTFGYNNDDTSFTIEFSKDDVVYNYVLKYNAHEIVHEQLTANDRLIFNRNYQEFTFTTLTNEITHDIAKTIRRTTLALFFAQNINISEAVEAFSWFSNLLNYGLSLDQFVILNQNPELKQRLLYALKFADLNIQDIEVEENVKPVNKVGIVIGADGKPILQHATEKQRIVDVYLVHGDNSGSYRVNISTESDGTRNFLLLVLFMIINNSKTDITILSDEFDSHLHPQLAISMIKLLNDDSNHIQFIASSHNDSLMDELSKNQVYFTDKSSGSTIVFKQSDFDNAAVTRSDVKRSTKYREGVYGATQIINYDGLLSILR